MGYTNIIDFELLRVGDRFRFYGSKVVKIYRLETRFYYVDERTGKRYHTQTVNRKHPVYQLG